VREREREQETERERENKRERKIRRNQIEVEKELSGFVAHGVPDERNNREVENEGRFLV